MIITDTGPLVAILDRGDARHGECVRALEAVTPPLVVTLAVLTEAMHILGRRVGRRGQAALADLIRESLVEVAQLQPADIVAALDLMAKYHDAPMDLADATLVVLADARGTRQVFSLDRHFSVYRNRSRHVFDIVPG